MASHLSSRWRTWLLCVGFVLAVVGVVLGLLWHHYRAACLARAAADDISQWSWSVLRTDAWDRSTAVIWYFEEFVVPHQDSLENVELREAQKGAAVAYLEVGDYEKGEAVRQDMPPRERIEFAWNHLMYDAMARRRQWDLMRREGQRIAGTQGQFYEARAVLQMGATEEALSLLKRVLRSDPEHAYGDALWLMARAELLRGNTEVARKDIEQYLATVLRIAANPPASHKYHPSFVRALKGKAYAQAALVLERIDGRSAQETAREALKYLGDWDSWYVGAEVYDVPEGWLGEPLLLTWAGQRRDLEALRGEAARIAGAQR